MAEVAGLYVHVPFCERACPYCDFDFEIGSPRVIVDGVERWFLGLEAERQRESAALARPFDTLYFGGGTPSAIGLGGLARLFDWVEGSLGLALAAMAEVTVELNPEHVDAAMLDGLVARGVGRVSLGVQTLDEGGLRELGRGHGGGSGRSCVAAARAAGLRVSADLILGWRGHSADILRREIDELLAAGAEHLSIYALTVEPDTPWPKLVRRGLRILPDDDLQAELLLVAEAHARAAGLTHYEVASYALPGAEAVHNSKYWRWRDVVGLGPSAASVRHGADGAVERRHNPRGLAAWSSASPGDLERLEGEEAAAEGLWLGLRRLRGLDVGAFLARFAVDRTWLEARVARQLALQNLEWAQGGEVLRVAGERWLVHDTIAQDVLVPAAKPK
nr:coproporphyrinogen-III oxidase family protein [Pseudenhygromyxa sp. WMMC2535]